MAKELPGVYAPDGSYYVTLTNGDGSSNSLDSYFSLFNPVDGDSDAFTDSSAASIGPLSAGRVRVVVLGGDAHLQIAPSPTPTLDSLPMPDGVVEYFRVEDGDSVAVLGAASNSGTLYVSTETAIPTP